jgi:hypothetical protein
MCYHYYGVQQVSFPPIFLSPQKYTYYVSEKILRANNIKKQADHGLTGGSTFDHDLSPPPPPPLPLSKQYHSLDKGISICLDAAA